MRGLSILVNSRDLLYFHVYHIWKYTTVISDKNRWENKEYRPNNRLHLREPLSAR